MNPTAITQLQLSLLVTCTAMYPKPLLTFLLAYMIPSLKGFSFRQTQPTPVISSTMLFLALTGATCKIQVLLASLLLLSILHLHSSHLLPLIPCNPSTPWNKAASSANLLAVLNRAALIRLVTRTMLIPAWRKVPLVMVLGSHERFGSWKIRYQNGHLIKQESSFVTTPIVAKTSSRGMLLGSYRQLVTLTRP